MTDGEEDVTHDASVQINVEPHGPDVEQSGRGGFDGRPPSAHRGLVPDLYLSQARTSNGGNVGLSN